MQYGKITNGILEYAPRNKGAVSNYNQDVAAMLADGYLPVISDVPMPDDGKAYAPGWKVSGGKIRRVWNEIEVPAPVEPTAQERVFLMETETGLTRAVRELVLAEGSGASEYLKNKAAEIEELAVPLREADGSEGAA